MVDDDLNDDVEFSQLPEPQPVLATVVPAAAAVLPYSEIRYFYDSASAAREPALIFAKRVRYALRARRYIDAGFVYLARLPFSFISSFSFA
jgi:hypothetical protein